MVSFLGALLGVLLIGVSIFAILLVLMQRPSEGGGFGTSLGGGAMESVFGGDAGGVLVRTTMKAVVVFFLLTLLLSLLTIHRARAGEHSPTLRLPQFPEAGQSTEA